MACLICGGTYHNDENCPGKQKVNKGLICPECGYWGVLEHISLPKKQLEVYHKKVEELEQLQDDLHKLREKYTRTTGEELDIPMYEIKNLLRGE